MRRMEHAYACRPGAAEFPHGNPRLDFGALWLVELEPVEVEPAAVELNPSPPVPDAPVTNETVSTFLRAAIEVAVAHGGGEQAGQLELLLGDRPAEARLLPTQALSERASTSLVEGKILERTDEGWLETTDFARQRDTWLGALRGDALDLSCCGDSTLDTFTANVVSRLLASPDKREMVRRDLRRRGVAAFGML
jgi:hypothetical protein